MSDAPRYRVELTANARKEIIRAPKEIRVRIEKALDGLRYDPRPHGCIKLAGADNNYRVRVGDWRIVYRIWDAVLEVEVIRIANRGDVYR